MATVSKPPTVESEATGGQARPIRHGSSRVSLRVTHRAACRRFDWNSKTAVGPVSCTGFHRIDLFAPQANELGTARSVCHGHQAFLATGAAGLVHRKAPGPGSGR